MRAIAVLFGGLLGDEAFVPLDGAGVAGKSAFVLALERVGQFPGVEKVIVLGLEGKNYPGFPDSGPARPLFSLVRKDTWSRKQVLEAISREQAGFDLAFFAWADCPFLDPALAAALADRHTRYAAEYSYADGYPYGFAPELLAPGTAGILFNIDTDDAPVERDALFQVIQKDINAFDIETEISPEDLRLHRLCLAADSRRNLLLVKRWLTVSDAFPRAETADNIIKNNPQILRTLPSFYNIQVTKACPQSCSYCPWPKTVDFVNASDPGAAANGETFMPPEKFAQILDNIAEFSSDAVVSLSLWGEIALHPQKIELIRMVLARPSLSLVVESSGVGWKPGELENLAAEAKAAPARTGTLLSAPLSWIVSLDAFDPNRYREVRGPGFAEASACAKQLLGLFPESAYVQAVRVTGAEDDIEAFYRYWKDSGAQFMPAGAKNAAAGRHVIIQKYNDFCGVLPHLQASDLSPVRRRPCWHLLRDMNIALDGSVLYCQQDIDGCCAGGKAGPRPNVFAAPLQEIWESAGMKVYLEHTKGIYPEKCAECDEYYTYNF